MHNTSSDVSRRHFIKALSSGVIAAGATLSGANVLSSSAWATPIDPFSFRQNAKPLLLHFNENSLGMSPRALIAAQNAVALKGNRYPMEEIDGLKNLIANRNKVNASQIVLGNGSTEIIGAVVALAAQLNATVIEPDPTFGDLRSRATARGLKVNRVPVSENFETDIEGLKKAAKAASGNVLVNLCNPNNPTGTIVDKTILVDWINNAPERYLFLIDEAYFEYAQLNDRYESALAYIQKGRENVIVTRTFSKIYGMAGLRLGYGMAAPNTAAKLDALAASFNLSAPGIAAATASLQDKSFYQQSLQSNQQARAVLLSTLDALNLAYIPSNTNFVLHKINGDLSTYTERMMNNGIRVGRRMTNEDGWNRLSLGTPEDMQQFAKTLYAFREKGWV